MLLGVFCCNGLDPLAPLEGSISVNQYKIFLANNVYLTVMVLVSSTCLHPQETRVRSFIIAFIVTRCKLTEHLGEILEWCAG